MALVICSGPDGMLIHDRRVAPNADAFDCETGANLVHSRRQRRWLLSVPVGDAEVCRYWPYETSFEDVLLSAQSKLDKMQAKGQI